MQRIERLQCKEIRRRCKPRRYPRVHMEIPVTLVKADDGEVLRVTALDVSPGGLRVRCDWATGHRLNPGGHRAVPQDASRL